MGKVKPKGSRRVGKKAGKKKPPAAHVAAAALAADALADLAVADREAGITADERVRFQRKEIERLKRQLREKETGNELILAAVQEIWSTPAEVHLPKPPAPAASLARQRNPAREIAVLHLSDVHVGKTTPTFDSATAAERLRIVTEKTREITDIRRSMARIDELRIMLGGDLIEGEEIFPHQAHTIDANLLEQAVRQAPEMLAELILALAGHFPKVHVLGVPGNHGRNGPKHSRSHPSTNWDSVCCEVTRRIVVSSLTRSADAARITWDLPADRNEEWRATDRVAGWGCLLVHGHQIRGMLGMPWYGFYKKVCGWIDTLPEGWDYVFTGHFHQLARFDINHRTVLANGCVESDNTYAKENLAATGHPQQRLCFFNEKYGMIADSPLNLSEGRKPNR